MRFTLRTLLMSALLLPAATAAENYHASAGALDAQAQRLRANPTGVEQKHPMAPGTAGHSDWLAGRYRKLAAKAAHKVAAADCCRPASDCCPSACCLRRAAA